MRSKMTKINASRKGKKGVLQKAWRVAMLKFFRANTVRFPALRCVANTNEALPPHL
jgi:hypothetical protein